MGDRFGKVKDETTRMTRCLACVLLVPDYAKNDQILDIKAALVTKWQQIWEYQFFLFNVHVSH